MSYRLIAMGCICGMPWISIESGWGTQKIMAFDRLTDLPPAGAFIDDLVPGTALGKGKYWISRTISSGGFGITYLATDAAGRTVVIKECFAEAMCRRSGNQVTARSRSSQTYFDKILHCFQNEARTLASLSHSNIVRLQDSFRENGTAYLVLDHIVGSDLFDVIEDDERGLPVADIVALTRKLIAAVGYVHDQGILHCDISPENIFLDLNGEPILLDFGSARSQSTQRGFEGPNMVKDGYSPHEQYLPESRIGPSTDLYALAGSIYHLISGVAPATCQSRIAALADRLPDPCRPLAGNVSGYPQSFLASVDKAMSVMPHARYQSAADWLDALEAPVAEPAREWSGGFLRRVMSFATL
jgi:serine/threonine protein kinase